MSDPDDFNKILKRNTVFIKNHPAFIITLFYVYFTILGVVYSMSYFNAFEINIFDYWSSSEYIFVLFQTPGIFIILAIFVALTILLYKKSESFIKRFEEKVYTLAKDPDKDRTDDELASILIKGLIGFSIIIYRKAFFRIFVIVFLLLPMIYAICSAKHQSNKIKKENFENKSRTVKLLLQDQEMSNCLGKNKLKLIGLTESFSFYYNQDSNYTHIVPNSNILELVFELEDDRKVDKKEFQNLNDSIDTDSISSVDSMLNSTSQ
ncbi:hypothetical protein N9164_07365 [Draconibacterium sp.]|nr:hypothetical protein [Draconibacterium sp.]